MLIFAIIFVSRFFQLPTSTVVQDHSFSNLFSDLPLGHSERTLTFTHIRGILGICSVILSYSLASV
jgi:hypothetical protein